MQNDIDIYRYIDNIDSIFLGSDTKLGPNGMLPRGLTPTTVVKPELYFPQCYAPSFNTGVGQFPGATNPAAEFKPPNGLPAQ